MNAETSLNFETVIPGLLKPVDVASILKISRSFAYRLLQTGEIPSVRIGKIYRVRPQDLERYIRLNLHQQDDLGVISDD